MELEEIRKEIDRIDNDILSLLSKRLELMPAVAEYKLQNNLEQKQPNREKKLLAGKIKLGNKHGLRKEYVKDIFKRVIEESHEVQKEIMKK